jgi:hypothetical protein
MITGRATLWERLAGDLIVDPSKLIRSGWQPASDSRAALSDVVRVD